MRKRSLETGGREMGSCLGTPGMRARPRWVGWDRPPTTAHHTTPYPEEFFGFWFFVPPTPPPGFPPSAGEQGGKMQALS